ncbi:MULTISPECIES: ABC transporter substrate-binding protein [Pseudomonas]|uniref:ABC transporter substrate-binding protein n=1 Tax=Pseudomonas protegens TaxID=380021 RepID=A0A9Q6IJ17_9PSED|nr:MULTISPECIES: transporter substrate-binding domain-containing protein [Pseudomonas]MBS7562210.1 transporter substrate-binding domain-containing protein [Pseudomonas sp. RC4D1]MBW8354361.1 transporter substrate-binding domain-containing protein [Pseudomonas sp.]MCO7577310.1 transporter substrate-binding domain-containing protein [Pseudomonas protegens]MCO7583974.1 transporter substrate-binding domain-containing protein [Pseudomonas chlororaphis]MCO7600693.1 transporter substrate-binding doma
MNWVLGTMLSLLSLTAHAGELRMLTDNHPPLHFQQGEHMTGFAVEVVQALAQRTGDPVQVQQRPMLRALRDASEAEDTAVFTILRTAERESRYQWVGPLMQTETALYARTGDHSAVTDLHQTRGQIAVPRKWLVYRYLKQQGLDNLWGVDSPQVMIRLLQLGRVQYLVADTMSVSTFAAEEGMPFDQLSYQMPLMRQDAYIAFSPKVDAARVARWQRALEAMKRDGSLQRLKQRWHIDRTACSSNC